MSGARKGRSWDDEGSNWWADRCNKWEAEVRKEATQRPDVLLAVVGDRQTFKMVAAILGLDLNECDHLCIKDLERERLERELKAMELKAIEARAHEERQQSKRLSRCAMRSAEGAGEPMGVASTVEAWEGEDWEEGEEGSSSEGLDGSQKEGEESEQSIHTTTDSNNSLFNETGSRRECEQHYDGFSSPYLRFLRRPPGSAASWRPRPRPPPTGVWQADPHLSLEEKSVAITNKIATEFCAWMRDLGSATPPEIDESTLADLFELTFDKPASHALVNRFREATSLSPAIARAWDMPQMDYRQTLRAHVALDVEAERQPAKRRGFGGELDPAHRVDPPRNHTQAQWLGYRPPADLATFTTAFSDLSHLESYTGYCKFLARNPDLPRPPCMQRWGVWTATDAFSPSASASRTSVATDDVGRWASLAGVASSTSVHESRSVIWSSGDPAL